MSIKIERKGDRFSVETDYSGSSVDHSMIHSDRELKGAMKSYGINEVRGSKDSGSLYSTHRDFDEKFKKKFGRDQGYFRPY